MSKWIFSALVSFFLGSMCLYSKDVFSSEFPTVAIDIGHLPGSPGAKSARGIGEYFFNKGFAELLAIELRRRNRSKVFILNHHGNRITIENRASEAKKYRANLLISIHHDSVLPKYLRTWQYKRENLLYSDRFMGYSIFYSEKNSESRQSLLAAVAIGNSLRRAGFIPTRHHAEPVKGENRKLVDPFCGVYNFDDLKLLRSATVPAVLLEVGVIVNRDEELKLLSINHRQKLVVAIANGVEFYLSRSGQSLQSDRRSEKKNFSFDAVPNEEVERWWHERATDGPYEGAGGRDPAPKEAGHQGAAEGGVPPHPAAQAACAG